MNIDQRNLLSKQESHLWFPRTAEAITLITPISVKKVSHIHGLADFARGHVIQLHKQEKQPG
jgi:hypothetical protein